MNCPKDTIFPLIHQRMSFALGVDSHKPVVNVLEHVPRLHIGIVRRKYHLNGYPLELREAFIKEQGVNPFSLPVTMSGRG